jgi:hypothetical protein
MQAGVTQALATHLAFVAVQSASSKHWTHRLVAGLQRLGEKQSTSSVQVVTVTHWFAVQAYLLTVSLQLHVGPFAKVQSLA